MSKFLTPKQQLLVYYHTLVIQYSVINQYVENQPYTPFTKKNPKSKQRNQNPPRFKSEGKQNK